MTLNRVKIDRAITFMKYLARVVPLKFLPKSLIWNKTTFGIKPRESCRAGGK